MIFTFSCGYSSKPCLYLPWLQAPTVAVSAPEHKDLPSPPTPPTLLDAPSRIPNQGNEGDVPLNESQVGGARVETAPTLLVAAFGDMPVLVDDDNDNDEDDLFGSGSGNDQESA